MAQEEGEPRLPIPVSVIQNRYLLFDIEAIAWLRKTHHICGVFIGTLPQNPSQNVFMGLPMEIMPEEAQLLIELGMGYILDDARAHDAALAMSNRTRKADYLREIDEQAAEISSVKAKGKESDRKRAMKKVKGRKTRNDSSTSSMTATTTNDEGAIAEEVDNSESLFVQPEEIEAVTSTQATNKIHLGAILPSQYDVTITPTTSATFLSDSPPTTPTSPPPLLPGLSSSSFNLYRHLNSLHYFQTPGLRFGCQFCVYPGDPLRFHSHFLAVATDWEDEIDLMDIVGGGRLGTGVKKGYLVGGKDLAKDEMRTFSIEWAAM